MTTSAELDSWQPGMVIGGKYALTRLLAHGGLSSVFEAQHVSLGRRVAIKVLQPQVASQRDVVTRLRREARAASGFEHPNIVEIYDFGQDAVAGSFYIVQKLLQGVDLRDHLERRQRLPLGEALDLLVPIMGALAAAHRRGVIHRDIKPENIFLARGPGGTIVPTLIDFGIAKQLDLVESTNAHTQLGTILGTVQYMSPEQARGEEVDARTDVWSLAVVLFELLTGRCPYEGGNLMAVLMRIVGEQPPDLEALVAVPHELATVVHRALEHDLSSRYPSMSALLRAVLAWDPSLGERHRASIGELDEDDAGEVAISVDFAVSIPPSTSSGHLDAAEQARPPTGRGGDPDALAIAFARTAALPSAVDVLRAARSAPSDVASAPGEAPPELPRTEVLAIPFAYRHASAKESEPDSQPSSSQDAPPTVRVDVHAMSWAGGSNVDVGATSSWETQPRPARAAETERCPAPSHADGPPTQGPWSSSRGATSSGDGTEGVTAATTRAIDAFDINALDETIALARRASEHPDATPEIAGKMRLIECMARLWLGDVEPAGVVAEQALALLAEGTSPWLSALGHAAIAAGYLGRRDALVALRARHEAVDEAARRTPSFATAACRLAIHLLRVGEIQRAEEAFADAQLAAEAAGGGHVVEAWLAITRAELALHHGDLVASLRLLEAAVEAFSEAGDARNACRQRAAVGKLYLQLGEFTAAERLLGQALDAAEAMKLYFTPTVRWQLAWALAATGRHDEALALFEAATDESAAHRVARVEAEARVHYARALLEAGHLAMARAEAEVALELCESVPTTLPHALAVSAAVAARRGDGARALALATRAAEALDALAGTVDGEAYVRLVHARALRGQGREAEAAHVLDLSRRRLQAAASRLVDEPLRRAFLERIPEHAATLRDG